MEQNPGRIKVLFLASNPQDTSQLALDKEIRELTHKIREAEHRDSIDLVLSLAARPDDLLLALNEHRPQIVHFSGHGEKTGELLLINDSGMSIPVNTKAIKYLFTTLKDNIRVVFLNACYSKKQAKAITEVIDCVIGMKKEIGDDAAIAFSVSFYRAIGFARSVKEAFEQGIAALLLGNIPEESTPELITKKGVDPSKIFLLKPSNQKADAISIEVDEIDKLQELQGNTNIRIKSTKNSRALANIFRKSSELDFEWLKRGRPFIEEEESSPFYKKTKYKVLKDFIAKSKPFLGINFDKYIPGAIDDIVLTVEFDNDMNACTFTRDNSKLKLDEPLLLWECPCKIPDEYRGGNTCCRFHNNTNGELIAQAFGRRFNLIKYDGIGVFWEDIDPLWPPSIDTIFMAKVLKDKGYTEKLINNIYDVGCGTGFLGIFLAKNNPYIRKVFFSDEFLSPLLLTRLNWHLNFDVNDKIRKYTFISDGLERLPEQEILPKLDLVMCNPPFLPSLGLERILYKETAVSGTHLLDMVINDTKTYARELVIGCGSIALDEFKKSVRRADAKYELLDERDTPFRVLNAFKHKNYINSLLKRKRVYIRDNSPFKFWFKSQVYKVTY